MRSVRLPLNTKIYRYSTCKMDLPASDSSCAHPDYTADAIVRHRTFSRNRPRITASKDLVPISRQYQGYAWHCRRKVISYFLIYALVAAYVLCLVPQLFDLVQIAQPMTLLALVPYILACIFFAMTCSIFIHHRESCLMIYVFTSVPLLFISGISWRELPYLRSGKVFSWIFPSTLVSTGL